MLDGSVIDASVDEMSCLWTWTARTIWWHLMICCMLSILDQIETLWIVFLIFSTPSHHGLQVVFYMAASSSKARTRPIPRDVSSSDESSHEVLEDPNILPRQFSLMSPRMPRLHSIKGPFKLVLGGILVDPSRSRTRRIPFKLIERLPDQLHGGAFVNKGHGKFDERNEKKAKHSTGKRSMGRCVVDTTSSGSDHNLGRKCWSKPDWNVNGCD